MERRERRRTGRIELAAASLASPLLVGARARASRHPGKTSSSITMRSPFFKMRESAESSDRKI